MSKDKRNISLLIGSYATGIVLSMAGVLLLSFWMLVAGTILQAPFFLVLVCWAVTAWREME